MQENVTVLPPNLRFQVKGDCGSLIVNYENGVKLGEMLVDVDGYYKWFPERRDGYSQGYWEARVLSAIAETLDKLNAPWERKMAAYFDNQEKENA